MYHTNKVPTTVGEAVTEPHAELALTLSDILTGELVHGFCGEESLHVMTAAFR